MGRLETIGQAIGWEWRTMRINPAIPAYTSSRERLSDDERKSAIRTALRAYRARRADGQRYEKYANTSMENRPRDIMSVTEYIERKGNGEW